VKGNRLILPKFNEGMKFRDKSIIPENIKQIIITRDVNIYYASIQYESDEEQTKGVGTAGIDVGIKDFISTSDGICVEPLNIYRKMEKKLKREQERL
jgi:putative transposase